MKQLVEYSVVDEEGQTSIFTAEVQAEPGESAARVSRGGAVAKSTETFQDALESVKPALQAVARTLNDINNPDEIEVEIGLMLTTKAGCVIASLDSEVNFKVTLKWQKQK